MQTVNGKIEGDKIIQNDLKLSGMITGSATVERDAVLELHGMICRDLIVEDGATVNLHGTVCGDVTNKGGQLNVFGTIQGRLFKKAGTTQVDSHAIIAGGIH